MFSASDLSEEQVGMIRSWVSEGAQMADVQKRLMDDFGLNVTYMDTRFLSLDLELEYIVEEKPEPEPEPEPEAQADEIPAADPAPMEGDEAQAPAANVTATCDQIARPGAMVSGTVTFTDGMKGLWLIDEMGRPSIDPDQPGYQPTQADLVAFQAKLRELLQGHM